MDPETIEIFLDSTVFLFLILFSQRMAQSDLFRGIFLWTIPLRNSGRCFCIFQAVCTAAQNSGGAVTLAV
ncbi:hypothetical protein LI073_09670 [bacterium 210917-SL.2.15]|nr:hypothetical protein [bacterium 210917-SL.2.15]